MDPKERIIVALDVPHVKQAEELTWLLRDEVGGFKLGLEFLYASVRHLVEDNPGDALKYWEDLRTLIERIRTRLFWDGKFNDIPNTLGAAAGQLAAINVWMLNVHASSGIEGMLKVVANKGKSLVAAVTVLTSFEENNGHLAFGSPTKAKVLEYARWAKLAGCDALISSPQELPILKPNGVLRPELAGMLTVVPGVRTTWSETGDQKRITTPADAVKAGADYLVIGRPITKPPTEIGGPVEAARRIVEEIASVS